MQNNYDYYRIFYYVAKYSSFSKAAEALMNNQPNMSRSIKNLEGALGCTLFMRSSRGVSLTPEGEKLYAKVSDAFSLIEAAEEELSLDKSLDGGMVSIGSNGSALRGFLLPILNEFHKKYPGVKLRIINRTSAQAVRELYGGLIDLAVLTTPIDAGGDIKITECKRFSTVPICGKGYAHLVGRTLTLGELSKLPLVAINSNTQTYGFYVKAFAAKGLAFSSDIEVSTTSEIISTVKHDLGIGFIPEVFLSDAMSDGEIFPLELDEPLPDRYFCLASRTGVPLGIAAKKLADMIKSRALPR